MRPGIVLRQKFYRVRKTFHALNKTLRQVKFIRARIQFSVFIIQCLACFINRFFRNSYLQLQFITLLCQLRNRIALQSFLLMHFKQFSSHSALVVNALLVLVPYHLNILRRIFFLHIVHCQLAVRFIYFRIRCLHLSVLRI